MFWANFDVQQIVFNYQYASATANDDNGEHYKDKIEICKIWGMTIEGQIGFQCHLQIVYDEV